MSSTRSRRLFRNLSSSARPGLTGSFPGATIWCGSPSGPLPSATWPWLCSAAGFPFTPIYLTWFLFVDGPHVMGTITRTYLDKRERRRLGWFLWVVVPFVLIGPVMVWAGQASLFYLFAVCWQHYHIAKQHLGFMMLWKAKNKERYRST